MPIRYLRFLLAVMLPVLACSAEEHPAASEDVIPPGLTIRDGRLFKDGKPFHGVGINYFTYLLRITGLSNSGSVLENRDYVEGGFRVLREHGIPFVRFSPATRCLAPAHATTGITAAGDPTARNNGPRRFWRTTRSIR